MKRIGFQARNRARGSICQVCAFSSVSEFGLLRPSIQIPQQRPLPKRTFPPPNTFLCRPSSTVSKRQGDNTDYGSLLNGILEDTRTIISDPKLPPEQLVLNLFKRSQALLNSILSSDKTKKLSSKKNEREDAISSLLELEDEEPTPPPKKPPPRPNETISNLQERAASEMSSMLNKLIRDPKVFISPEILHLYTTIQCQLKNVDNIPKIFNLYANKPAPRASGDTIEYHSTNPNNPQNAIPTDLANQALQVAMEQKNLALSLAIIDSAFCTPAFRRSKVMRKTAIPMVGLAAAPPAAYMAASYISTLQDTMDGSTATWITFSAILAYITFTSSVGLVAIATANDHMNRVVWMPGMALRQRWMREEERAALDKIAQAWGFKDPLMRGEEEGEEWDALREFIGMRGMILDKTDLMEGME
ncbi:hypothetical protein FQN57_006879 [Myotisia sp. PD_48]|nr:hypothetical protein FQN57_006879 [Myotisia sp. PD_48]